MAPTNIQLPNNTDSIDFVIYNKFESATPGQLVANAYWGSITQALVFGIILLAVCLTTLAIERHHSLTLAWN